jgi:hypothetical protein
VELDAPGPPPPEGETESEAGLDARPGARRLSNLLLALAATVLVAAVVIAVVAGDGDDGRRPSLQADFTGDGIGYGDHWHAALGVYHCDHWVGGASWRWPAATEDNRPGRFGRRGYAGLHSHEDGLVHMEPGAPDEAGANATLGRYFDFGGWTLSEDGFRFLDAEARTGDECAGEPAAVRWSVDGVEQQGDPAAHVFADGEVIVVAFVPAGTDLDDIGEPPSVANLHPDSAPPTTFATPSTRFD